MPKATTMIVISFFERSLCRTYIYLFIIITNVIIVRFTAMYLYLVYYIFTLTFPFEEPIGFISTIAFRELNTLLISEFFVLLLLIKFGMQL